MEINLDCSDIVNNEISQFLDNNSQICLNQEEEELLIAAAVVEVSKNGEQNELTQNCNLPVVDIQQVHIAFKDDLEEIKLEDPGISRNDIEDGFFMQDFSPIRADKEDEYKEVAPKSIDTIRALGTTNNPQIKKLFTYNSNEEQAFTEKAQSVKGATNNLRQWHKQPDIKAKVIGTQMMKPPVPTLALHGLERDQKSETTNFKQNSNNQGLMTLDSNQDLSSTGNLPTQMLGSTATSTIPLNKQWQKVQIAKRRPITASQQPHQAPTNGQRSTSTSSIITKTKLPINISNIQNSDIDDAHPRTYREKIISSPNIKQSEQQAHGNTCKNRRRRTEPDEIIPVFDCLFCCQEHFVLSKQSENNMTRKYANDQLSKNIFVIDLYMSNRLKVEIVEMNSNQNNPSINMVENSVTFFRQLHATKQFQTPIQSKYINIARQKLMMAQPSAQESLVPKLKLPTTPINLEVNNNNNMLNMAELDESALYLEDGTELLGARHGMKTRRQRIVEQISFETNSHNIYDPLFTSDEENQSQSLIKIPEGCNLSQLPPLTTRRKQQVHFEQSSSSMNSLGSSYVSSQTEELEQLGEESFSSIEKQPDNSVEQIDGVFGTSLVLNLEPVPNTEQKGAQQSLEVDQHQVFMQTGIINIQENKFTPEQEDKESQRYTFGCITPKGISMAGTAAFAQDINAYNPAVFEISVENQQNAVQQLQLRSNETNQVQIFQMNEEPLLNSDQSPISHRYEEKKTIQEFSPVIINSNQAGARRLTENHLFSDDQDSISKINFHPPSQVLESLEDGANFTRLQVQHIQRLDNGDNDSCDDMSLKLTHQAMIQNFMNSGESQPRIVHHSNSLGQEVGSFPYQKSHKEVCFSPISHENSISKDCIQAVVAVQEAIQGPCFNSIEYYEGETSLPNYKATESLHQVSNQMFNNKEIMMTSNFPDNFRISVDPAMFNPLANFSGSLEKSDQSFSQPPYNQDIQTINLGQNHQVGAFQQNHSFSAFNSKHVLNNNNNHLTPQVIHHNQQRLIIDQNSNHHLPTMILPDYNYPNISTTNQKFQTLMTEGGEDSATRHGKKKSGKKFLIKQEQLSQLLQMALEKKHACNNLTVQEHTIEATNSSNINNLGINQSSGYHQIQFFDSIVKQNSGGQTQSNCNQVSECMSDLIQKQLPTYIQNFNDSSNSQSVKQIIQALPKHHKKQQKTQDFNKNVAEGILKANPNHPLVTLGIQGTNNHSTQNLHDKRAPKIPTTSIGQNTRKILSNNHQMLEHLSYQNKGLHVVDQAQPSRQPSISGGANRAAKNYHLSLNNAISNSHVGSKKVLEVNQDPQSERPLTLRHHYQNEDTEDSQHKHMKQIEVSPNLLMKAARNFQKPLHNAMLANQFRNQQQLTKEELANFLKSAICSSRYSSSSAAGTHIPGFAGQVPSSNNPNNINFNLLKQMSIDTTVPLQSTAAKQRLSNSNFKQNSICDEKHQTLSPKIRRRKPNHFKQEPLLTEGAEFTAAGDNTTLIPHHHHHQLSIDNQATIHKSSGKINDRRDSSIRGIPSAAGPGLKRNNDSQKALLRKANPLYLQKAGQKGDVSGQLEKVPSKKFIMERAASGKQNRMKKTQKVQETFIGSKERTSQQAQKTKKNKSQATKQLNLQQQQQMELQTYVNLCNSINFANDLSGPTNFVMQKNQKSSQTNLNTHAGKLQNTKQNQQQAMISTSMINENTYTTKNLYNSNALLPHNSSSIIPNQNHHYYHHHNSNSNVNQLTATIDTSQNLLFGVNNPLITSGAGHTSGAQCEMSTTISNNQLSLTRLASGAVRGLSNGKGNQTISSGGQNQSHATNQTTMQSKPANKVVIPQLQLNKIKSSSSKRVNQLNGSQDEIQLQNLLLNLNQHLQANPYQTRVSLLKEGSNTVSNTPHGGVNTTTSFQKGILSAAAAAQSQAINTKRSQASSLSQQRPNIEGSKSIPRNQEGMQNEKSHERGINKHIDYTVQNIKKKQDLIMVPPLNLAIATSLQPDRRQKSKEHPSIPLSAKHMMDHSPQNPNGIGSITKQLLQNSFTLKQLKLINAAKANLTTQQQLTGRLQQQQVQMDTQRQTERTVSNNNKVAAAIQDNSALGGGTCRAPAMNTVDSKEKSSQKRLTKLLIKNQKHIIQNTRAGNELKITQQMNRSSLNPHKDLGMPLSKFNPRPSFPLSKKKPDMAAMDPRFQNNLTLNLSSIAQSNLAVQKQPSDMLSMNRFYDTGRQTLISQVASPHKNLMLLGQTTTHVSQTQVPTQTAVTAINTKVQNTKGMTTALGSKNSLASNANAIGLKQYSNQFSLKSIFSKNPQAAVLKGNKKQGVEHQLTQQ